MHFLKARKARKTRKDSIFRNSSYGSGNLFRGNIYDPLIDKNFTIQYVDDLFVCEICNDSANFELNGHIITSDDYRKVSVYIRETLPKIQFNGSVLCYTPSLDVVNIRKQNKRKNRIIGTSAHVEDFLTHYNNYPFQEEGYDDGWVKD